MTGQRTLRSQFGRKLSGLRHQRLGHLHAHRVRKAWLAAAANPVLPWARLANPDDFIACARKTAHELRLDERAPAFVVHVRDAAPLQKSATRR